MEDGGIAPHVRLLLRGIAEKLGLKPNFKILSANSQDPSLGGFHGVVRPVELTDGHRKIRLIVKTAPTDKLTRDLQQAGKKFHNEIHFYERLVGCLGQHGQLPRIPVYYGSSEEEGKETVVLEDLRADGFAVTSCRDGLDAHHLALVSKALAVLHTTASQWRTSDRKGFDKTTAILQETFFLIRDDPEAQKLAVLLFEQACSEAINSAAPAIRTQCESFVKRRMVGELNAISDWVAPPTDDVTLLHGDAWCHNFMFKYNFQGQPTEVALIDWQMIRLGSPCFDLAECVLSSGSVDVLTSPTDFIRAYADATNSNSDRLAPGFARWGRAGLLLALCIVINAVVRDDVALNEKFKETLAGKVASTAERTRTRLAAVMRAVAILGILELE